MESFIDLVETVINLPEEDLDNTIANYEAVVTSLPDNVTFINEAKLKLRIQDLTATDILNMKEDMLKAIADTAIEMPHLSEKKKELLLKVKDTIEILIDKILDNYEYVLLQIPVELCNPEAKLPTYAHEGDAGFDFYLLEDIVIPGHTTQIVKTGLKMAIPTGYELQIRPRSGTSVKTSLRIANAPGTIDSGYRDEIGIICTNISDEEIKFAAGDRIAQGVLNQVPKGIFNLVEDITKVVGANRNGGFGSTGQ